MSTGIQAYKSQQTVAWTRIEMLIALYDAAISRLESVVTLLEGGDIASAAGKQTHVQKILLHLIGGIDLQQGEIAERSRDLLVFVASRVGSRNPADIKSAIEVLRTLREGFDAVRDQAIELEAQGEVPPIDQVRGFDQTIG